MPEEEAGSGGAGIAALRARGCNQAGILTSSASNAGPAETGAFGAGVVEDVSRSGLDSGFFGPASLAAISKILAVVSLRAGTPEVGVDAAREPSSPAGSAKSSVESCSCRRLVSILSACVELSAAVRKSALVMGRESCLISVLNSSVGTGALGSVDFARLLEIGGRNSMFWPRGESTGGLVDAGDPADRSAGKPKPQNPCTGSVN